MAFSARICAGSIASRKTSRSAAGMARRPGGVEQLGATPATRTGRSRRDAVAVLAEDDPLTWRGALPQPGEVAVLPAALEQLAHGRLVLLAAEEGVGVSGRAPEREQRV